MTRHSHARRNERGAGLVELLVVLAISSIVLATVGSTFTSSLRLSTRAADQGRSAADARLVLDTVNRRIRVAVRPPTAPSIITRAEPGRLTFYASLGRNGDTSDPAPTRVEYFYDTCLREALTVGTAVTDSAGAVTYTWPTTSSSGRCIVFGQVDADGAGMFAYFDSPDATTELAGTGVGASDAVRNSIRSISIRLSVRAKGSTQPTPTRARARISLINRLAEDAWRK